MSNHTAGEVVARNGASAHPVGSRRMLGLGPTIHWCNWFDPPTISRRSVGCGAEEFPLDSLPLTLGSTAFVAAEIPRGVGARAGVLLAGGQAAGFWLLEVDPRAEADEWGRRAPHGDVEIRKVAESR